MAEQLRLTGHVVPGRARGRRLGFPTANVQPEGTGQRLDVNGVWAGWIRWAHTDWHLAVVNVGHRPTFGETAVSVEAHIIGFAGDLYGRKVELLLVQRLRTEQRFGSVEELVAQIDRDIQATQALLAGRRGEITPMEETQ